MFQCKEDRIKKWKEKAKLGFVRVHDELLRHFSTASPPSRVETPRQENRPIPRRPDWTLPKIPAQLPTDESKDEQIEMERYDEVNDAILGRDKDVKQKYEYIHMLSSDYALEDLNLICRDNQTCDDFYNYSVNQVFYCFHMCSVDNLAEECRKQKLDGKFFKGFDIDILRKAPYNLDPFSVVKVRTIIDGWRPKLTSN